MSKGNRNLLKSVLLLGAAMLVFTGCGGNNDNSGNNGNSGNGGSSAPASGQAETTGKKDVKLTITAINDWITDLHREFSDRFTKETGIEVEWQLLAADQFSNVLKTRFSAGEGPDMSIIWSGLNAVQFQPEQNFADLSSESWVGQMKEDGGSSVTYDGKVLGWPMDNGNDGWAIQYNKKIFDELQLSIPTTFDELMNASNAIKEAGYTPFYEPLKDAWHPGLWLATIGPLAEKNNPGLYDKLNNDTVKFADVKEFETAISQFKQMYDAKLFGENAFSDTNDKLPDQIATGKYAMAFNNANFAGDMKSQGKAFDSDNWGMFPVPLADNRMLSPLVGSSMMIVNKNGKHVAEAKQFLNFMSETETIKEFYERNLRQRPPFEPLEIKRDDFNQSLLDNSNGERFKTMEIGILYWDNTTIGKHIQDVLLGGIPPKEALEAIDADRAKMFKAMAQ